MSELFTEKYFPIDFREYIGNSEIVSAVEKWADGWDSGKKQKPLFLHGPTGTGKTCLAILIAKLRGWQVFEMNASDTRSKDAIDRLAGAAVQAQSFTGKPRLILLDEVDGLQARKDRGGAAAITAALKEAKNPVILTANEIYKDQKLAPIREACQLLGFRKINYLSIGKRLKELCELEKITFDEEAIKTLAKNSGGDLRAALSDLQTLGMNKSITPADLSVLGFRERNENVFKVMETMFKAQTLGEVRSIRMKSEINSDLLLRWVEENIPRILNEGDDTARAFDQLSKADIFNGRIRKRQYYGFLRYSSELMSSGVVLSRENDYHGWLKFQFPGLLKKLSRSSSLRQFKRTLALKIGGKTHSSARSVMVEDFPYLSMMFSNKENAVQFSAAFDLDEKEIAFLMGSKPTTKKVKDVYADSQTLKLESIVNKRKFLQGMVEVEEIPVEQSEPEHEEKKSESQTRLF